jgi:hypothetical protein
MRRVNAYLFREGRSRLDFAAHESNVACDGAPRSGADPNASDSAGNGAMAGLRW